MNRIATIIVGSLVTGTAITGSVLVPLLHSKNTELMGKLEAANVRISDLAKSTPAPFPKDDAPAKPGEAQAKSDDGAAKSSAVAKNDEKDEKSDTSPDTASPSKPGPPAAVAKKDDDEQKSGEAPEAQKPLVAPPKPERTQVVLSPPVIRIPKLHVVNTPSLDPPRSDTAKLAADSSKQTTKPIDKTIDKTIGKEDEEKPTVVAKPVKQDNDVIQLDSKGWKSVRSTPPVVYVD